MNQIPATTSTYAQPLITQRQSVSTAIPALSVLDAILGAIRNVIGVSRAWIYENDTGPDDANHAQEGIFIWNLDPNRFLQKADSFRIYDIAPTVLKYFGIEIPQDMIGKSLIR